MDLIITNQNAFKLETLVSYNKLLTSEEDLRSSVDTVFLSWHLMNAFSHTLLK